MFFMTKFFCCRYFDRCTQVFPYKNKVGFNNMHKEKNHSTKHGPIDIARWEDIVNMSCDAPETDHKFWIKGAGGLY